MKSDVYKIGKTLGLNKKDIDNVLSAKQTQTGDTAGIPSSDLYKSGSDYGTVSPKEIYKGGNYYGTISPKELYKSGSRYGTIGSVDLI